MLETIKSITLIIFYITLSSIMLKVIIEVCLLETIKNLIIHREIIVDLKKEIEDLKKEEK